MLVVKIPHFIFFFFNILSPPDSSLLPQTENEKPLAPPVVGKKDFMELVNAERLQTRPEFINIKHAEA